MSEPIVGSRRQIALLICAFACAGGSLHAQQPDVIRRAVTVVPIDVRVLDRAGNPIVGLTADDFTILEDGIQQRISHFSAETLKAREMAPGVQPQFRETAGQESSAISQRTFLLFIGRGRVQDVAKGFDGLIEFVRDRLLPQDQVAVAAYNKATDVTTDHAAVLLLLEGLRAKHSAIEAALDQHFGVSQILYGSPDIPQRVQDQIDSAFSAPGLPPARAMPPPPASEGSRAIDGFRRTMELVNPADPEAAGGAAGETKEAYDDLINLYGCRVPETAGGREASDSPDAAGHGWSAGE